VTAISARARGDREEPDSKDRHGSKSLHNTAAFCPEGGPPACLGALGNQSDMIVGSGVRGRPNGLPNLLQVMGFGFSQN
jgi:hypothetical protein